MVPIEERQPVSIIICAKNEATNLKKNLPAILKQRYNNEAGLPLYEVIVVNDASTDDTEQVLSALELQYDHLWDIVIPQGITRDLQGKKFALNKGISYANNSWLLLTDADCAPASDQWLALMTGPLSKGKEIVAGYGGYRATGGILNAFIRWETLHTFLQYSTYSLAGRPYMGVGRNMACTKDIIERAAVDDIWNKVPSGDDDLLVAIAGNANNTAIVADKNAFTITDGKNNFREWMAQKRRHLSTGKYYREETKWLLGLYGGSHALLWLCFFPLLALYQWKALLVVMSIRCVVYWFIWFVTAIKIREQRLLFLFPLFDIGWMVYNFAFFPYITWKNKKNWK